MKLIAGLGNPGLKYKKTRHNAGFLAVDFLIKNLCQEKVNLKKIKNFKAIGQKSNTSGKEILFLKPQTFMNLSGIAILQVAKKNFIKPEDIIILHDELDLDLGNFKIKNSGSSAGHNGIKSIIEYLGSENFWRIRIGIANDLRQKIPADKFVLSKFSKEEIQILEKDIFPEIEKEIEKII